MPRATVSQRLRATLKSLIGDERKRWGAQAAISRYSHERPGGTKILPQEISAFLNNTKGRRGLQLDDLDDIAAYFNRSIGDLIDPGFTRELTPLEQRTIHAFRALGTPLQEHFLALVETASVAARVGQRRIAKSLALQENAPSTSESSRGGRSLPASDATQELVALRAAVTEAIAILGSAVAGEALNRAVSGAQHPETKSGGMAD